jgi:hypothetical protein
VRSLIVSMVTTVGLLACVTAAEAAPAAPYFKTLPSGLNAPRDSAGTAPLPDGRVVLAGGENSSILQTAELFDPVSRTFTALPTGGDSQLGSARYAPAAAPLPDGRVLFAGGAIPPFTFYNTAELFDPTTNTFSPVAATMGGQRFGAAAAPLPDGRVLIAGGNDGTFRLATAELFDPATETFTPAAGQLETARFQPGAAPLPDGRVLVAGGVGSGDALDSAETFDPGTGEFTTLAAHMQARRSAPAMVSLPDGKVLIAGGNANGPTLGSAEIFDPVANTFTLLPPSGTTQLQMPRSSAAAAPLPDGTVLIAGGLQGSTSQSSAEIFVPAPEVTATTGALGDVPMGRSSSGQTLVITNVGAQALTIAGSSVAGGDTGDFAVTDDSCAGRRLAFRQTCTVTVRFTPQAEGARSTTLTFKDNEPVPTAIPLSGHGLAAVTGPQGTPGSAGAGGTQGPAGAQGPAGDQGPAGKKGADGKVEVVTCTAVTVKVHGKKRKLKKCSARLASGPVKFTTAKRASLRRAGLLYATGFTARATHGRLRLQLTPLRKLTRGRYVLTIRSGRHVSRQPVTIGGSHA